MKLKDKTSLIIGISIPILMIIFVAASIYLPRLFVEPPAYDFLYSIDSDYGYYEQGITMERESYEKLFIHDVEENKSRIISSEESEKLNLDPSIESPDGFEIVRGSGGGFLFNGRDYNARYIKGHNISDKLNLEIRDGYYYYDFRFIGWIIE